MKHQIKRALQDAHHMLEFLRELEPFVYHVCYHFMGNQQDAETLAERTLLTICQELHTFDVEGVFHSWVYRIILRLQESMQNEFATVFTSERPLQTTSRSLSGVDRQIYILRFVLNVPLCEVAELLRLKDSVVQSRFAALKERITTHYTTGGEAV